MNCLENKEYRESIKSWKWEERGGRKRGREKGDKSDRGRNWQILRKQNHRERKESGKKGFSSNLNSEKNIVELNGG